MSIVSDIFGGIGNFISNNARPIIGAAATGYGIYSQNQANEEYINQLRRQEAANAADIAARSSGGGGGGGGGGSNRRALQQASDLEKQYLDQAAALYRPYADMGVKLLPYASDAYTKSLETIQKLHDYMLTPEQLAKLNQSVPAYSIAIPDPAKKNAQ